MPFSFLSCEKCAYPPPPFFLIPFLPPFLTWIQQEFRTPPFPLPDFDVSLTLVLRKISGRTRQQFFPLRKMRLRQTPVSVCAFYVPPPSFFFCFLNGIKVPLTAPFRRVPRCEPFCFSFVDPGKRAFRVDPRPMSSSLSFFGPFVIISLSMMMNPRVSHFPGDDLEPSRADS